ncbi:OsmC family protein [Halalkalibacter krulwichiae]|uniref:OsmC-like protein n=1 Tax=Halalkalibacter krulwichiae TaxID=199441 RepID=A0A1X9MGN9_9BACI|nr:OsmC family protein [Halalkalibacter krulwichiae]ARK32639.1 OsmC-like protein [Halalkalibacter krulwichiae]
MVQLKWKNGENEIANGAGVQIIGSKAPDQNGLSPKEMIEGALALCISISLEKVLERDGIELDLNDFTIDATAKKEDGVTNRFTHFDVRVTLPQGLEEAYQKKLFTIVERACTISNTFAHEAEITISVE